MAVMSPTELADARKIARQLLGTLNYSKPTVNDAIQAIEDWFEANRSGISTVIDTATFEDPHQYAQGLHHVFVAGRAALLDGEMTGARPGRVLRSSDYR